MVAYMLEDSEKLTTIRVKKSTVELIDSLGKRGESYEDILIRLLTPKSKKGGND